ncbi:MAG TPA: hypothetical protein DD670_07455, partial [Planctomycetaceae bacterium]|nr:hypothetical protein [Planctomycetaceae bacterium]
MIGTDVTNVKRAALDLAKAGFAVFPCKAKNKAPACPHGFKDASTDPAVIEKLFSKPNLNLAIATGPASGCWVLDVENLGLADLARLEREHGELPQTVSQQTGGGGVHYFFKWDGRRPVTNKAKLGGLNIDVRGDGGYVVVPPSVHDKSGEAYEWGNSPGSVLIAEAPAWLVE